MKQFHSNYSTLLLAIIREQIEMHHKGIALQNLNLSSKELEDLSQGKRNIDYDFLVRFSLSYNLFVQNVIDTSIKLNNVLASHNYFFQFGNVETKDDDLLNKINRFFNNLESLDQMKARNEYIPILSNVNYLPTFFCYCIDEKYQEWYDLGAIQPFEMNLPTTIQ